MLKVVITANTDWFLFNYKKALGDFLLDRGFRVVLASPPGPYADKLVAHGFEWKPWHMSRQVGLPWQEIGSLIELFRIYRHVIPDIVHHHTIKTVLYGSLSARFARVPCIVNSITGRGYIFQGEDKQARIIRKLVNPFFRAALGYSRSAVIFEHEFDRQFFVRAGLVSDERSWIIPGAGADPERFTPKPEAAGVPVVLMAGRMLWDKGVGVFVEAARLLKPGVEARFVLVGNPDPGNPNAIEESILQGWNEEGIVEWWGWRSEMQAVFHQSHVVVLPTSYGEGVPNVLIEAAACGKPFVVSDRPGCLQIVQHEVNGLVVPAEDPQKLAQAIGQLVENPLIRSEMGKKSRAIFLDIFTNDKVNEDILRIYNGLLGIPEPTIRPS